MGYINKVNGPVRLDDMSTHPESVGLPENHPLMRTFLGIPVYHRDEHVGNLYLTEKEGGQQFSKEDEDIAAMFAAQAASIISNIRRYEAEHRAKAELETLLDITPLAISVFDARVGEITFMNRESQRMLGVIGVSEELINNPFLSLKFTRTDGREIPFEELPGSRSLQTGETVKAEEVVIHLPDGSSLTSLINCAPLFSESGEIVSVLSVIQDMTPLEDLERQRGEFLGLVSEELRMPLTSIKGSAAALRSSLETTTSTEAIQLLRIIDQQTDLMRSQVNTLTELTQIETGSLSVFAEPTDVAGLIEESCREYLRDHDAVAIHLEIPDGQPTVMADRHRIGQVLHNFLRQAAKHSNESSPIQVSTSIIDIYVAISVSVKSAIAPSEKPSSPLMRAQSAPLLKRVSEDYNRAAELSSQGEGLALAFCRGVVEAHGGRMRTEVDEEKGGLTLTFTLQTVEEQQEILAPDLPEIFGGPSPAPVDKSQIIISIQDPKLLNSVQKVLLNAGYRTLATSDLLEVEQQASSESAKLIVMDIAGREEACFRTLLNLGNTLNLPSIVLCDRDDEKYVVRAFEMGADGYMVKPFSPSELIARIRATLRRVGPVGVPASTNVFQLGDVAVNFDERTVNVSGHPVQLTATEYKLLTELANCAGRVLTQDELLRRVWGPEYLGEPQLLRSYVKSLRQKLGDDARKPSYIFTEHGVGYRMAKTAPGSASGSKLPSQPHPDEGRPNILESNSSLVRNGSTVRRPVRREVPRW